LVCPPITDPTGFGAGLVFDVVDQLGEAAADDRAKPFVVAGGEALQTCENCRVEMRDWV
jgi:hypothetical protein